MLFYFVLIISMANRPTTPTHSAGEWHIDREATFPAICIKSIPGRIVCDIVGNDAESEANARLIAAAPNLLEYCETLLDDINHMSLNSSVIGDWDWSITTQNLKVLIAKAKRPLRHPD